MAATTPKLGLIKPLETEYYSIGVFNENADKIDAAMTEIDTNLNGKASKASPTFTGEPKAPTAAPGSNTTQLATTAFVQAAVSGKANQASPAFTGTPTAPTPASDDDSTKIATTAFVQGLIEEVKDSVSDGKAALASAITDKGVSTGSSDSFDTMAANIRAIETGPSEGKEWSNPTGSDGSLIVDARTYRNVVYAKGMFYLFSDKSSYDQARFARLSPRDYDQVVYSGSVNAQNTDIYIDNVSGYDNQFKLYLMAYGNNVFVTQSRTDNTMYYSTDAKHWFSGQVLSVSLNTLSYIKECSKFVGVSGSFSDKVIYFSDDGINWTMVTTPEHSDSNIVYGNRKYVFLDDGVIYYSEDLINWGQVTISNNEITYGSSLYYSESGIFVLSTNKSIYTSVDGVNWMLRHTKSHPFTSQKIVYGNGKYIIQGTTDNSAIVKNKYYLWSKDGITWEELEFPWMIYDIDYGSGVFCACGSDTSTESSQRGRIVISRSTKVY